MHRFNLLALGGRAVFERMNDGHGRLAFAQVARHRLAKDAFGSGEVENVVNDLEGHAEVAAVLAEARFLVAGRTA